jgi:IS4 transposase
MFGDTQFLFCFRKQPPVRSFFTSSGGLINNLPALVRGVCDPARRNSRAATHQDGRPMRRYRRRWIIERTNAWLQNFRRLVVRYERKALVFLALVHMACALIALKRILG